jgi:hypothetical protein
MSISIDPVTGLPKLTGILITVLVLLAITAFAAVWIYVLVQVWKEKGNKPPNISAGVEYFASSLTALVGGVVAMVFGTQLARSGSEVWSVLFSSAQSTWVYAIYTIAYIVLGIASGVTWAVRTAVTPPLVKNFGMTALGLVIAVVGATFGVKR